MPPKTELYRDITVLRVRPPSEEDQILNNAVKTLADRMYVGGSGAAGQVVYVASDGSLTSEAAFAYDDSTNILTVDNVTASGTIQAEQLTSTDDITLTGLLTDTSGEVNLSSNSLTATGNAQFGGAQAVVLTVGNGTADVDYQIVFNGQDSDGRITWQEDEAQFGIPHPMLFDPASNYSLYNEGFGVFVGRASVETGAGSFDSALAFVITDDAATENLLGIFGYVYPDADNAHTQMVGVMGWVDAQSPVYSGTTTTMRGSWGRVHISGSSTATEIIGVSSEFSKGGFGAPTLTSAYLFKGELAGLSLVATNFYGLYLPAITGGSSLNWAIYTQGGDLGLIADGAKVILGAGSDASIQYDNTNLLVNPKVAGSGVVLLDTNSKVSFRDTALGIYSQADTFLDLFADGAVRIGNSSAGAPTNYSAFEADGTLEFNGNATVWDELPPTPIIGAKLGSTAPTLATFVSDIQQYTFDATNDFIIGATEITHRWKEGTTIVPHIHWATNGLEGTAKGVQWRLKYTISDTAEAFSAQAMTVVDVEIPASTTDRTHFMSDFDTPIDGTNLKINAYICWRLERVATDHGNGEPAADPFGIAVGFHMEIDTVGSRTITEK